MSLDTLLPKLDDTQTALPARELSALSGLQGEERERFLSTWRTMSIQRRRDLIDLLADIAEDNVELDFNGVFMVGLLDDDVQVRAQSVKALWEYDSGEFVAVLLRLLGDPEAIVRAEAALGLGRFLLRAEVDESSGVQTHDIETALRGVVRDEAEVIDVRGRALEALGVRSEPWVRGLIEESFDSGDRRMMISAVHAMGRSADPDWLPQVMTEMASDDPEMRFEAATAAGGIGDEEAIPHLLQLASDEDAEVQEAAIAALGEIGGFAARDALRTVGSESDDERVLTAVTEALAQADFVEDPLGFKMYLDQSVADDADEDSEE
ncbi:MAG: HEAT repeat domain-containing protein [Chloroflexi bacterium]|nr:HEAT repeat domain-containing protein [Chloroflexota bacterium]